ncbi:solute carrier family 15 member 5 isoform X1 [Carcharodon carcharias]|uniref:solute carrier family 15 member 5 isoform X1 n=1 Tax=Carcharodon carcharias TaxID=13397 RepID=UPI001B7ED725|nr:solute carrier family 15 member 5 isoform X1 [Carcharodon carcharias]XP_041058641.1 solute carrier family 15 member 5 isoform X1 [Carcharodon carcharias]
MAVVDLKHLPEIGSLSPSQRKRRKPRGFNPEQSAGARYSRKKLQIVICLLSVELCERFTYFGIVCNMILFCTLKLGYKNYQAAIVNLCFVGASTLTPVLVGWFAESCMGRTKVVYICAFLHFIGTVMLPVVAFPFEDFYIDTHHTIHALAKKEQTVLFYIGLMSVSLGSGGIRAVVCPFSAYRLQDYSQGQLLTFFNWFHWFVNLNSAVVFVSIAYIQQSIAKNLGFLIPFASVLTTLLTIHMVQNRLIYRPKSGGSLMTVFGVLVNALKMCCMRYRHISGDVSSWLDRAKENYGGWYSEAHVDNVKCLVRLIPLFAFQILYRFCILQIPSTYFIQTMHSNLNLRGFLLPIAALNVIGLIPVLLLAPFLEYIGACLLSVRRDPLSPLAQMVTGHLCAVLSIVVAGISEVHRRSFPLVEQTLSGKVLLVSSMPCFQLAPQYLLLGIAEALVTPACTLITFRLSPKSIQGIAMQFMTLFNGAGCFVGAIIIQTIYQISGGDWFPNNLNVGNLDTFFFLMAAFVLLNLLGLWQISHRYRDLQQEDDRYVKGALLEKLIEHEKSLKFYDSVLECPSTFHPGEIAL